MTATLPDRSTGTRRPARTGSAWSIGAPRLLAGLTGPRGHDRLGAAAHHGVFGALRGTDLPRLLTHLEAVDLRGRGGAGFPLAAKIHATGGRARRLIVNGTESEPGSGKDRLLLTRSPHLVLDGALVAAACLDAREVIVAVHDHGAASSVRAAAAERPDARAVRVHEVPTPAFVAGEARALARSVDGGPALPPGRRTHLAASGTLLANVESFAQLAVLLRLGPQRYAETGAYGEPGTTLVTLGGAVARPGVVEMPLGTPLGILLGAAGTHGAGGVGGVAGTPRAVVLGGYHGRWLRPDPGLTLARTAPDPLGAGVVLVLDDSTCALGELTRVTGWLASQSAGQCGPCRFGLPALADAVAALADGRGDALPAAVRLADSVTGRGACHHPNGTSAFVHSGLRLLQDELAAHRAGGCGRPVLGRLPLGPTEVPA